MKIMHIITSLGPGGAEAILYRLCQDDKKNTHIVVSLMGKGKYGELLEKTNIKVFPINFKKGQISIAGLIKLKKIINQESPDVVQTWLYHANLVGGLISKISNVKSIIWSIHHTAINDKTNFKTYLIIKLLGILSYAIPNNIIYCAKSSQLAHENIGYRRKISKTIYNGFDTNLFRPKESDLRKELKIEDNIFLIGMVARYDPIKDFDNLLKSLELLKQKQLSFKCIMAGKDVCIDNQELLEKIKKFNLSVEKDVYLLGSRNDIPDIMSSIDILVLSSKSEAFPNVLGEAMSCETLCVTTDVGDSGMIVDDYGWVVPPNSSEKLFEALEAAFNKFKNKDKWQENKILARKRIIDNFSSERMLALYQHTWSNQRHE